MFAYQFWTPVNFKMVLGFNPECLSAEGSQAILVCNTQFDQHEFV